MATPHVVADLFATQQLTGPTRLPGVTAGPDAPHRPADDIRAADDTLAIDTTIVVPTYNESANIRPLVDRLSRAFAGRSAEIVFADDSTDDTPAQITRAARTAGLPVRMLHREGVDRVGGLAGAVTSGIAAARGEFVVVMDGDLQHPPEMAPLLRDAAQDADLAVASRYLGAGDASGLSARHRRLVSSGSTVLAQACFPRRVGKVCTDPMTGFFCFRRASVDLQRLRPRGFKILLEILARHHLDVREIPFAFGKRLAGESKASWRNGLAFLHQMLSLRMGRMARFAAVGALGTVVNLAVMALLVHEIGTWYIAASVVAAELSILFNFVLQERFVFRDLRDESHGAIRRLTHHLLFNNAEAALRLPFLVLLVSVLHVPSVLAQGLLLAVAFVARFLFASRVVYRPVVAPPIGAGVPALLPVQEIR